MLRFGRYLLISQHDADRADAFFQKWGSATAFFSRLSACCAHIHPLPAGIAKMPFLKFCIYTFLGSFPWSLLLAYAGYVLGNHLTTLSPIFHSLDVVILLVVVVLVVLYIWRHISGNIRDAVPLTRKPRLRPAAPRSPGKWGAVELATAGLGTASVTTATSVAAPTAVLAVCRPTASALSASLGSIAAATTTGLGSAAITITIVTTIPAATMESIPTAATVTAVTAQPQSPQQPQRVRIRPQIHQRPQATPRQPQWGQGQPSPQPQQPDQPQPLASSNRPLRANPYSLLIQGAIKWEEQSGNAMPDCSFPSFALSIGQI